MTSKKDHWERIYSSKSTRDLSWTQSVPRTSLDFIHSFKLSHEAPIIDVGGGESCLVDYLLDEGFTDVTVLDISSVALEKARHRLGPKAKQVSWIVSDITEFVPEKRYMVWHDRATFHFLTTHEQVQGYLSTAVAALATPAYMTIGTFSEHGPKKCSGLDVHQYSEQTLEHLLEDEFEKIRCLREDHITPFQTTQNFLFCSFSRRTSG